MQVLVICSSAQLAELGTLPDGFLFSTDIRAAENQCDAVIDFLFEEDPAAHTTILQQWSGKLVIVGCVALTCSQLPPPFIRINAWPGFWEGSLIEACSTDNTTRAGAATVLSLLGKSPEWVPDVPGMISARIVASIINEAYFALSEGIATAEAIDTAMKLGTAYPYGPLEWAKKIGLEKIVKLLSVLAQTETRYVPCDLLQQAVNKTNGKR